MADEVLIDRTAFRRHRRGMLLSLLTFALYLPAVILTLVLMAAVIGREAAGRHAAAIFLVGFVGLMTTFFVSIRDSLSYRCPRCGRRLPRVVSQSHSEPSIHYHCTDCWVIWDLGWTWSNEGGLGG